MTAYVRFNGVLVSEDDIAMNQVLRKVGLLETRRSLSRSRDLRTDLLLSFNSNRTGDGTEP